MSQSPHLRPAADEALAHASSLGNVYLLSCSFNQDSSCFVCGTTAGLRVYTAEPVCEVQRREGGAFRGRSVICATMLQTTNIFALVTGSRENPTSSASRVQIWDDHQGKFIHELRPESEVKGIDMRRDTVAVVCEHSIQVYTCGSWELMLYLTTHTNPRGLCTLATGDTWMMCCPGLSSGSVRVQTGLEQNATHVFKAHKTPLVALALNASGSLVATASESGTTAQVFQTADGQVLYTMRMGPPRVCGPTLVSGIVFRPDDRFLAVASQSEVRLFKLDPAMTGLEDNASAGASPVRDCLADLASTVGGDLWLKASAAQIAIGVTMVATRTAANILTSAVKSRLLDLRCFAHFQFPDTDSSGCPSVDLRGRGAQMSGPQVAFYRSGSRLLAVHCDGVLYELRFRPEHDPSGGPQDLVFASATTWFAARPDFRLSSQGAGSAADIEEADEFAEWQLL